MNNKGQVAVWAYGLMLGIVIIILALGIAPATNEVTQNAMNVSTGDSVGLDCSNSSISNFDKGTCVTADYGQTFFIGGLLFIGGAVIAARFVFS